MFRVFYDFPFQAANLCKFMKEFLFSQSKPPRNQDMQKAIEIKVRVQTKKAQAPQHCCHNTFLLAGSLVCLQWATAGAVVVAPPELQHFVLSSPPEHKHHRNIGKCRGWVRILTPEARSHIHNKDTDGDNADEKCPPGIDFNYVIEVQVFFFLPLGSQTNFSQEETSVVIGPSAGQWSNFSYWLKIS